MLRNEIKNYISSKTAILTKREKLTKEEINELESELGCFDFPCDNCNDFIDLEDIHVHFEDFLCEKCYVNKIHSEIKMYSKNLEIKGIK